MLTLYRPGNGRLHRMPAGPKVLLLLAVVLGGLELAKRHMTADPAQAVRHIENATEGADRAAALTKRLLAFSRAEPVKPEPIEVRGLIAGMSSLLDRTLGDAITVETRDDGRGWSVWADRHQLENAILNLAVNARDAMEGRGRLVIACGGATLAADAVGHCAAGDYVTIAVTDTGCGMASEVRDRVFEPFFTTKPVGKGTGLGLSQIFGFVRQNEGEIAIDSTPGLGTTVTLYLPRREAAAEQVQQQPVALAPIDLPEGLEILVVEDDPRVLAATMGALRELGHRPTGCGDPLQAETMMDTHGAVDLVITDVLMPGRTGPEVIAAIAPRYPHVAVLFVTGFAGEAGAGMLTGQVVLRKPFTINALGRAVAEAMAVARPVAPHRVAAE